MTTGSYPDSSSPTALADATSTTTWQSVQNIIRPDSKLVVLSGAGCSTASGLGDYRDKAGQWKRQQPITGQVFINDQAARHRYWARSAVGWPAFSKAEPNRCHTALAELEKAGVVTQLITQNVDQLHQQAGHKAVIDLHGVLASVSCIECHHQQSRDAFQVSLLEANPWLTALGASYAPDGDADLQTDDELMFKLKNMLIPPCPKCTSSSTNTDTQPSDGTTRAHGIMKPDVVFFGESVPKERVEFAMEQLRQADALLVAGSSLMVFSGFRFCRDAHQRGQPIIIFNDGATRADDLASVKVGGDCGEQLSKLVSSLGATTI